MKRPDYAQFFWRILLSLLMNNRYGISLFLFFCLMSLPFAEVSQAQGPSAGLSPEKINSKVSSRVKSNEEGPEKSGKSQAFEFTVIAHRGASGYLPEHTLEAATLAFALNADFIEQDVVITKDDIPIVLHDIHLETVTNVESVFPERAREDDRFYARDFTLAELRRLNVHEREDKSQNRVFPSRFSATTSRFSIATLYEHFDLISELNRQLGKNIGVYPEVKSPAFHLAEGVDASRIVIDALQAFNLDGAQDNSYLQCFDFSEVKRIRSELGYKGKVVMLIGENDWKESSTDYTWIRSAEGMAEVAKYANGIGPWVPQLFNQNDAKSKKIEAANWVTHAHSNNLTIHPYTYRQDALPPGITGPHLLDALRNIVKVDGIFTDHVPPVLSWREQRRSKVDGAQ
jgi:glycerophosphoryl diester phosphodiesterase